ncbi:ATP-dependent RNA helicase dbp10 [Mycoemilia scoparia]|uniref:RNA helicase n=1 Tax=Mycoemilia scoparia TaxID=417184 RepID=A0A9W7ZXC4_9FUNG|nr:ATP-dependent RNA helicase dbp10 [Mycoemilia scoparia]
MPLPKLAAAYDDSDSDESIDLTEALIPKSISKKKTSGVSKTDKTKTKNKTKGEQGKLNGLDKSNISESDSEDDDEEKEEKEAQSTLKKYGKKDISSINKQLKSIEKLENEGNDDNNEEDGDEESDGNDSESNDEERDMIHRKIQAQNRKSKKSGGFQSMGLMPNLFKAVLHKGFKVPTPIQRKTIPHILEGHDLVGMARTGSGKTAAFVIPMINRLKAHSAKVGIRSVILSPSRELALQTLKVCKELGKYTDLRAIAIVGGDSMEEQFTMLASNPDIVVATPGRFLHLMVETKLELKRIEYVVFDEADRLFEMGFSVQLHELLHRFPASRQTLLFSATLPSTLVDFAKAGLQDPMLIRLDVDSKISKDLEMAFFTVKKDNKDAALISLLRDVIKVPTNATMPPPSKEVGKGKSGKYGNKKGKKNGAKGGKNKGESNDGSAVKAGATPPKGQTIVFVSTKHHVEYISQLLEEVGFLVSHVYGSLDQVARQIQITRFREGITHVMVVTDVAARGIDIPILENVINYDFVDSSKVFVHRVGRVARAGRRGWAYSLVTSEELPYVLDLQLFLGRPLKLGNKVYKERSAQPNYTEEIVIGQLPPALTEFSNEFVVRKLEESVTMEGLHKTAANGFAKYSKSRQAASHESYRRAKELISSSAYDEPHVFLSDYIDDDEQKRLDMVKSISGFRPNETIFEVGRRGTKNLTDATIAMKNYRLKSGHYIAKTKSKRESMPDPMSKFDSDSDNDYEGIEALKSQTKSALRAKSATSSKKKQLPKSYRDEDFYISHYKADANTEKGYSMTTGGSFAEQAQNAMVSIAGDDLEDIRRKQKVMQWDSKKKKYVKGLGIGSDNKKLITGESGVKLPASFQSGTFEEWQKKTKMNLPRVGEQELSSASKFAPKIQGRRFRHTKVTAPKALDPMSVNYERKLKKVQKTGSGSGGGSNLGKRKVRSELKSVDEIRKERMEKEKRREKSSRPTHKHSKKARRF